MMQGLRVYESSGLLNPGEYKKMDDGSLYFCAPNGLHGQIGETWQITEHSDGTITVMPSILISNRTPSEPLSWHGFLEKGVWREC